MLGTLTCLTCLFPFLLVKLQVNSFDWRVIGTHIVYLYTQTCTAYIYIQHRYGRLLMRDFTWWWEKVKSSYRSLVPLLDYLFNELLEQVTSCVEGGKHNSLQSSHSIRDKAQWFAKFTFWTLLSFNRILLSHVTVCWSDGIYLVGG